MKKSLLTGLFFTLAAMCLSAGDVATFVDKGFSADGKYYIFGQYGRTDKKYQGWAEIYQVDIAANDYVDSGIFRIKPTSVTSDRSGPEVYESLEAKSYYYLKNIKTEKANPDHVLYICDDVSKKGTDVIKFTDFLGSDIDNPNTYNIELIPTVTGKGKNVKSSFYINLTKKNANGNVILTKKIGNPGIVRKGISNYKIERIMCDQSEKNFIFVIEKIYEDETGINVRYMVEASKIN
ncbi:MAG: DUF2259 domain-containing protein [Treponema sp.]|nr:DUF2259 domain-containing protein [Treponema sp.]